MHLSHCHLSVNSSNNIIQISELSSSLYYMLNLKYLLTKGSRVIIYSLSNLYSHFYKKVETIKHFFIKK